MSQAAAVDHLTAETISAAGLPAWLERRKLADHQTFLDLPTPDSSSMEDWRRTNVSHIDLRGYAPAAESGATESAAPKTGWERSGEGGALVLQQVCVSTAGALALLWCAPWRPHRTCRWWRWPACAR